MGESPLLLTAGASRPSDSVPEGGASRDLADAVQPEDAQLVQLEEAGAHAPTELGRVLDREARDVDEGARGLLRLEVPTLWLEMGGSLAIEAPTRLVCARCDGGGCASCANSGALRVDTDVRTLEVTLSPGSAAAKRLRIEEPFGASSTIRQMLVDLVPSDEAVSPLARWTPHLHAELVLSEASEGRARSPDGRALLIVLVVLSLLGLALALHLR